MQYKEQIDLSRIPQHVAIIMDGNGRWAKQRGHERSYGHQVGAETVHVIADQISIKEFVDPFTGSKNTKA